MSTDMVNHPPHYAPMEGIDFDCIDVTRHMSFDVGNAVKYMWRADRKNGREDLEKAQWYIRDAIRHGDPVFVGGATWGKWHLRMTALIAAQTDAHRKEFFRAVQTGHLSYAALAIERMLK